MNSFTLHEDHLQGFLEVLCFAERTCMTILLAEQNLTSFNRPLDANLLIVPTNGSLCLRCIDVVDLIGEHGLVAQHQESVCKATGDEELAFVLGAKLRHDIPTERRRLATQIDSHIKYFAFNYTN